MNWKDEWDKYQWSKFERWNWGTWENGKDVDVHARLFAIKKDLEVLNLRVEELLIALLNQQIGEEE